jgi:hypothetical protein
MVQSGESMLLDRLQLLGPELRAMVALEGELRTSRS